MSLAEIKRSIQTVQMVKRISSAMRVLSMSLHSRVQKKIEYHSIYSAMIEKIFFQVADIKSDTNFESFSIDKIESAVYVVIGSRKGLCGSYNDDVAVQAKKYIKEAHKESFLFVLGKKLYKENDFLALPRLDFEYIDDLRYSDVYAIAESIFNVANLKGLGSIIVISSSSKSIIQRRVDINCLSTKSLFSDGSFSKHILHNFSDSENSLSALYNMYVLSKLQNILLKACLAEQAARFISVDSAYKNADESLAEKKLLYNRQRQSNITAEIQDIIAGSLDC